jgi:3-phosphoshikimate 1-carboxyvinyltransferase
MAARFEPSGPLRGTLRPPPDKSVSHRAALIAAMAEGETTIAGYLDSADTRSTLAAVEALGARVLSPGWRGDRVGAPLNFFARKRSALAERSVRKSTRRSAPTRSPRGHESVIRIRGVGLRGPKPAAIDVGNAGTLLRLLPGWLAGQPEGQWTLDGDASIRRRPVDRIVEPLRQMGARLSAREDRLPPLEVEGAPLHGISYELPVASAQVKSCLLFAGLLAEGETRVVEPLPTRDHTERMLAAAGAEVGHEVAVATQGDGHEAPGQVVSVRPCERLEPGEIVVPADFSSAAFFIVAALLLPGSEVELAGVGLNPTRTGLISILCRMGAEIEVEPEGERGGEPSGLVRVRSCELRGTEVGGGEVPLAIDELPLVALAACFAAGETTIRDAGELRRKESDRIVTVTEALTALGATVEATADGMRIEGTGGLRGGAIDSHGDHRIAMLGAVAGLASRDGVEVAGMDAAAVSYPRFAEDLAALARTVS